LIRKHVAEYHRKLTFDLDRCAAISGAREIGHAASRPTPPIRWPASSGASTTRWIGLIPFLLAVAIAVNAGDCIDYVAHLRGVASYDTLCMMNHIAVDGNRVYLLGFPRGQVSGLTVFDISTHPCSYPRSLGIGMPGWWKGRGE
jgi:hypothetical protein